MKNGMLSSPGMRTLLHLIFLTFLYLVLLNIFTVNTQPATVDHIYTSFFLLTILPVMYVNLEFLLPVFAKRGRWVYYLSWLIIAVLFFTWINHNFFQSWSASLLPDYYFISYYSWLEILLFFVAVIALTTLIKLSRSWFSVNELQQRLLLAEKEKVDMELAALKAQINPHFFFNTLNSVYALSLAQDEKLPGTILRLSGIMRYYLYEAGEEMVSLEKEVSILQDYIQLQKIRSDDSLLIETHFHGDFSTFKIAPLILLTFVENAFKHGAKGSVAESYIRINLEVNKEKQFVFAITNNIGVTDPSLLENKGLGLENVKRRLELLYKNRYALSSGVKDNEFYVHLKMLL